MITNDLTKQTTDFLSESINAKLTLGKLINSIRLGEEISQVQFAKILGVSRQQLCDIEHDRKTVSPKLAAKYADILGYYPLQFIRLSLQSIVDHDNLDVAVEVIPLDQE
jgi:transcriptional regulator with XRE-family HTH domain